MPPAARTIGPAYSRVLTHWTATAVSATRATAPARFTPAVYQNGPFLAWTRWIGRDLSQPPHTVPHADLARLPVLLTVVDGHTTHRDPGI